MIEKLDITEQLDAGTLRLVRQSDGNLVPYFRSSRGDEPLDLGDEFRASVVGAMVDRYRRDQKPFQASNDEYKTWRECLLLTARESGPMFWTETQRTVGEVVETYQRVTQIAEALRDQPDIHIQIVANEIYDKLTQLLPLFPEALSQPELGYWEAEPTDKYWLDCMANCVYEIASEVRRLPKEIQTSPESIAKPLSEWAQDIMKDRRMAADGKPTTHPDRKKLYRRIDQRKRDNVEKSTRAEIEVDHFCESGMSN